MRQYYAAMLHGCARGFLRAIRHVVYRRFIKKNKKTGIANAPSFSPVAYGVSHFSFCSCVPNFSTGAAYSELLTEMMVLRVGIVRKI